MKKIIVESFTMDHTKVEAPFVRKCGKINTPKGDVITKFDLRFTQPNKEAIPTGAIHSLEHLMAGYIREKVDNVVDLSPMGCRTGFYLIVVGEKQEEEIADALIYTLKKVLDSKEVPAANKIQCGNYRDMSLFGAKEFAKEVLDLLQIKYGKKA
ncbi:S-ribosylhomocysteine lyase [Inediibacterium massiliense]|uniref:S-ribosylhomocysteine lyase n=1 Tax=Inediibacterium massiliense TaxID=1658111 RepID=UPI0006B53526|nr:S-ribosylhomocysteine lyase [Inediibacterium massiliense]